MSKILVVGGEGYIGNVVVNHLLNSSHEVVSYDNLLYENEHCVLNKIHNHNYKFIYGDMNDKTTFKKALEGVDSVVLLAGLVGDPITKKYPSESHLINDLGVKNVIDLCSEEKLNKFIFISTCSNYGLIKASKVANEDFILNPLSSYAKSKVEAEKYILSI
ncbi:NAD(P)-dependent oxidoreductase, partial [Candidatus Marinimicrobia bacterium]|nr:NAD(P)-dependent oxidoreductase [Candidatus Neomarinimicrobiota bacterium]